jgi:uncharacterized OsmC-like protein
VATKARVHEFEVALADDGTVRSGLGGTPIVREEEWWAEHLVLAGLVRCTRASLLHAARRASLDVSVEGSARGTVTKREHDGRYAFVEIESSFDVSLVPLPEPAALAELLDWTERGCFVGNSLTASPRYVWTVNGEAFR